MIGLEIVYNIIPKVVNNIIPKVISLLFKTIGSLIKSIQQHKKQILTFVVLIITAKFISFNVISFSIAICNYLEQYVKYRFLI